MSKNEFATNNFFECFGILLKEIVEAALAPIQAASLLIAASVSLITGTMNSLMGAILYLRNAFGSGFGVLGNRSLNALTLITKLSLLVKNSFNQGQGILVTIMYIFLLHMTCWHLSFLFLLLQLLYF